MAPSDGSNLLSLKRVKRVLTKQSADFDDRIIIAIWKFTLAEKLSLMLAILQIMGWRKKVSTTTAAVNLFVRLWCCCWCISMFQNTDWDRRRMRRRRRRRRRRRWKGNRFSSGSRMGVNGMKERKYQARHEESILPLFQERLYPSSWKRLFWFKGSSRGVWLNNWSAWVTASRVEQEDGEEAKTWRTTMAEKVTDSTLDSLSLPGLAWCRSLKSDDGAAKDKKCFEPLIEIYRSDLSKFCWYSFVTMRRSWKVISKMNITSLLSRPILFFILFWSRKGMPKYIYSTLLLFLLIFIYVWKNVKEEKEVKDVRFWQTSSSPSSS